MSTPLSSGLFYPNYSKIAHQKNQAQKPKFNFFSSPNYKAELTLKRGEKCVCIWSSSNCRDLCRWSLTCQIGKPKITLTYVCSNFLHLGECVYNCAAQNYIWRRKNHCGQPIWEDFIVLWFRYIKLQKNHLSPLEITVQLVNWEVCVTALGWWYKSKHCRLKSPLKWSTEPLTE